MPALVGFSRHFTRVGGIRQHGHGEGGRHLQHLIFLGWTVAKIINDDRKLTGKDRAG
ncbi:hypothetical protein D3C86_2180300 [compost metagenome]